MSENQEFDYKKFESLKGLELGIFCSDEETLKTIDIKFLEYFKENCENMDDSHLEHSLFLLEKVNMKEAYPFVVNYIDHPVTSVRMPAIRFLSQWLNNYEIDDAVLSNPEIITKIEETLAEHSHLMGVEELKHIIERKQMEK